MTRVAIALGANLGDRRATLEAAVKALRPDVVSDVYENESVGYAGDAPRYLNAVALLTTDRTPQAFLAELQRLETKLGRVRGEPNAPRTLDLDILLWGNAIIDEPGLVVPHPRMHERDFVLVPLAQVAPDWRHPRLGRSALELLRELPPR